MNVSELKANKRIIHFVNHISLSKKTKKVGDILANLGLDKIGTGKNDLSINHDKILYK